MKAFYFLKKEINFKLISINPTPIEFLKSTTFFDKLALAPKAVSQIAFHNKII